MNAYWTKTGSKLHALLIEVFDANLMDADIYPNDKINIAYAHRNTVVSLCS